MKSEIIALHRQTSEILELAGETTGPLHLIQHDIHSYLPLTKHSEHAIHLQGYPGLSQPHFGLVCARLMNYRRLRALMENPHISPGNEHAAVITDPSLNITLEVPDYDPHFLANIILTQLALYYSSTTQTPNRNLA